VLDFEVLEDSLNDQVNLAQVLGAKRISGGDACQPGVDNVLVEGAEGLPLHPLLEVVVDLLLAPRETSTVVVLQNDVESLLHAHLIKKKEKKKKKKKKQFREM